MPNSSLNGSYGNYDEDIKKHYDQVAQVYKDSPTSTMGDEIIRKKETDFILNTINEFTRKDTTKTFNIIDVGCGNGYTLSQLAEQQPHCHFTGMEFNDSLRGIATDRLKGSNVAVVKGDIRDRETFPKKEFDVLVCQRVIINLLNPEDQKAALNNLVKLVAPGGLFIFIEAFQSGLKNLNEARKELNIPELPPAHHNLYLQDDFFNHDSLVPWQDRNGQYTPNHLSTHYYVTRVWHELVLKMTNQEFIRNSHFVNFFSNALPNSVGNYSPLKMVTLTRRA